MDFAVAAQTRQKKWGLKQRAANKKEVHPQILTTAN